MNGAGARGARLDSRRLLPTAETDKMKSRLVWLLLCLIWGSTWLFIKLGLDDLPPFTFAGIRFVVASAILFGIISARRLSVPRTRADWSLLAVTGLLSFSL